MATDAPATDAARSSSLQNIADISAPTAERAEPVSVEKSAINEGASSQPIESASHNRSRPSASVLSISTVRPLCVSSTSPGRKALPLMAFSAAGTNRRKRTGSACAMIK